MGKSLFVTEKPSVAMDYVKVLNLKSIKKDGYIDTDKAYFTWCVGHMVTMSYPEKYDEKYKRWNLEDLPFLPYEFIYEIIPNVEKQFNIVKNLLNSEDVDKIYVCTDSGREGEYIFRLVDYMAKTPKNKEKRRVWIDSQTEEEVKKGIKNAKLLSDYDSLSDAAYLRAKEDYLLGINLSRVLTLFYGNLLKGFLNDKRSVIAVGRVMTCVLGMIVDKENEIRKFVKSYFYKLNADFFVEENIILSCEWKVNSKSKYFDSPKLYNETGFKEEIDANNLKKLLMNGEKKGVIEKVSKTKEKKFAPLLYNLAELQNECSKRLKISPDDTLNNLQVLYEKKMVTYPRTDARVLSTSITKEIDKNIKKLKLLNKNVQIICDEILNNKWEKVIIKSKYVDDKKITDHYAITPTGEGLGNYSNLNAIQKQIYDFIVNRFLAIFYPPAIYSKLSIDIMLDNELFGFNDKTLIEKGYLKILGFEKKDIVNNDLINIKKGMNTILNKIDIKQGETSSPKRYSSGSIVIAMENAGKLIENEELREHIKSIGIGTSATRASILKKLETIDYIKSNTKTQILKPTLRGELIYSIVKFSIPSLLNPKLTASWEKGLNMVYNKEIENEIFMNKLKSYIEKNILSVTQSGISCFKDLKDINERYKL